MSRNVIHVRARPEDVFRVLSALYTASIVAQDEPRRLLRSERFGPIGVPTEAEFLIRETEDGSELVLRQEPVGLAGHMWNPVLDRLLWARNVVALERLQSILEEDDKGRDTPRILGAAAALAFWGAGAIRGDKVFHPRGDLYEAELTVQPEPGLPTTAFFDQAGARRAVVRLSRGAGLPSPFPDFPGLAIKLPDRWGPGADQDFLLVSSGPGTVGRRVLMPAPSAIAPRYSSLTPYATGGSRVWFGAEPTAPERFAFQAAFEAGNWRAVGSLVLGPRIESGDKVDFDVWNTHEDLVPSGLINALRKPAYAGSREGREERS